MADTFESKIKAWLTPGLISCFGIVSWNLISEIRTDVKALLASNAQVQVKIENLERRLNGVEDVIYSQRIVAILPKETELPKKK
jgi:regulator of replication initiation timing